MGIIERLMRYTSRNSFYHKFKIINTNDHINVTYADFTDNTVLRKVNECKLEKDLKSLLTETIYVITPEVVFCDYDLAIHYDNRLLLMQRSSNYGSNHLLNNEMIFTLDLNEIKKEYYKIS